MRSIRLISRSVADFFRDDGIMLAGSMSYFSMMALVPFCLFLMTLFGYFLGEYPEFYRFFLNKLSNIFPDVTHVITDEILKLTSFKGIGTFSLILYGLLSYQVFASLERSLNVIFKVKKKRHFIFSVLTSLLLITVIIALLMTSFAAASFIPLLKTFQPFGLSLKIGTINAAVIRFVLPFVLVLFTITMMYVLLPRTRVRLINAFKGALFTTVLMEIAKHVFTWYVGTVVQFGRIYGSLTAGIVCLLWVFYSSSILLIGAEVVHNLGGPKQER